MTVNWSWLIQGHPVKPRWPWSYRPSVKRQKEYVARTIERIGKDAWNEKRRAIRHKNPDSHRVAIRRARSNFIDAHGIEAYRARAKKHREDFKARYIAEHGLEGWKEYKRRTDSRRNKNAG